MKYLEIAFWKVARWLIIRGYGPRCATPDWREFTDTYTKPEHVFTSGRCPSCQAWEAIDWIDNHIRILK